MHHLRIIAVGKLKEPHMIEAQGEFLKRLHKWCKIELVEIREEPFRRNDSHEVIKKREAEKIQKYIHKDDLLIILDETGENPSSQVLAKQWEKWTHSGKTLTFIIGGPLGLDPGIQRTAGFTLSLSNMTFTHQFARIMLLEQIYRSCMILDNRPYHY